MTNNDLLIRLRYALDLKNKEVVEIFKLGGVEVSFDDVANMLIKVGRDEEPPEQFKSCSNKLFEAFLNGLITFKRGPHPTTKGPLPIEGKESPNNLLMKKVKIALSLTAEDMLDFLYEGGITVSKGELGAILRNASHKNYKECGDSFVRYFLRGLTTGNRS